MSTDLPEAKVTSHFESFRCDHLNATVTGKTCVGRHIARIPSRNGVGGAQYPVCGSCRLGASHLLKIGRPDKAINKPQAPRVGLVQPIKPTVAEVVVACTEATDAAPNTVEEPSAEAITHNTSEPNEKTCAAPGCTREVPPFSGRGRPFTFAATRLLCEAHRRFVYIRRMTNTLPEWWISLSGETNKHEKSPIERAADLAGERARAEKLAELNAHKSQAKAFAAAWEFIAKFEETP